MKGQELDGLHDLAFRDLSIFYRTVMGYQVPKYYLTISDAEKKERLHEVVRERYPSLPESLVNLYVGVFYAGDCGRPEDARPDWLDMDKFKRGQEVTRKYLYAVILNAFISTPLVFTFLDMMKPVVVTGKTSTPFAAFRRYLKTINIFYNWYYDDPFAKGTRAFKDTQLVRRLHLNLRKKMLLTSGDELDKASKIENSWSPTYDIMVKDFEDSCNDINPGQCPFSSFETTCSRRTKGFSQAEMSITQFALAGMIVLFPKGYGMYNATEEELEAHCYVWRCLGYLLGIDDEFNFCRGSLSDVRQRSRELLDLWLKPSLPNITREWEHMIRCLFEGVRYYFPLPTFDLLMLHIMNLLDVKMPRLESSIRTRDWIWYKIVIFILYIAGRVPGASHILNKGLLMCLNRANNFTAAKHKQLRRISADTWEFQTPHMHNINR